MVHISSDLRSRVHSALRKNCSTIRKKKHQSLERFLLFWPQLKKIKSCWAETYGFFSIERIYTKVLERAIVHFSVDLSEISK